MAIHLHQIPIVDALCQMGADINGSDEFGNTALLIALKSQQIDTAATLVSGFLFDHVPVLVLIQSFDNYNFLFQL